MGSGAAGDSTRSAIDGVLIVKANMATRRDRLATAVLPLTVKLEVYPALSPPPLESSTAPGWHETPFSLGTPIHVVSQPVPAPAPASSGASEAAGHAGESAATDEVTLSVVVPRPRLWSAETPDLYCVVLTLLEASSESGSRSSEARPERVLEALSLLVGFRKIRVRGNQLTLNGRPLLIKGVNRHEHDPYTGHVVSQQSMRRDVAAMKALHINAVRSSHYPNDPYWLYLADRYGLYIVDEANIESHGAGWGSASLAHHPAWRNAHVERVGAMVSRDRNHPSVIIYSLGNEAGNGVNFHAAYREVKRLDPSRPVQYERALKRPTAVEFDERYWGQIDSNTDVIAPMYPSPDELEAYAIENGSMPLIM